ncbi:hypothetical protein [Halomicrococcus sp. NG-SE-24]|uniref:hypothetical protein n=1 Tax=Halomicrococcus sp. NG-SE-24 TaxID=3436928 RepID=UPI003D9638E4
MGRTNATYRDLLRAMESRWSDYRRALRREDQAAFDRLFEHARAHADAGGLQNHQRVEVTVLVSVVLEQQKRIDDLEDRLDHLEADLNADLSATGETTPEEANGTVPEEMDGTTPDEAGSDGIVPDDP